MVKTVIEFSLTFAFTPGSGVVGMAYLLNYLLESTDIYEKEYNIVNDRNT